MALLTLQTYAPAGGQGHRTSLRGGGPLTTLVDPRGGESGADAVALSLWRKLWANVATVAEWRELPGSRLTTPSDIFPWMAPTRTSSGSGSAVTPADAHPAQAYFGMPRRIRLEFAGPGRCDLTGIDCEQTVTSFRMRNYGIQYSGWKHPLSPYYRRKDTESWLPVHGQPGGLSWRDWIGLTLVQPAGSTRAPARAVSRFVQQLAPHVRIAEVRLHAFGYDMDNMKARGWIASERPLFAVTDPHDRDVLADTARRLSAATDLAAAELTSAGKNALFNRAEDVRGDFSQYRRRVWNETESAFFAALHRLISQRLAAEDVELIARDFLAALNTVVLGTFDDWCPIVGLAGERLPRLVRARFTLVNALRGTSTSGAKLFEALGLPAAVNAKLGRRTKKHSTRGAAA
jgi:CRISPR system Cascade subunit CasA